MILRNPLTSPVRGARQNGRAPSRAFGRAQKAIYAGSIRIPQDAGYRGYAEDIQLEQQLIRKLLYSPTGLSTFFLEFVQNWFAFSKKPSDNKRHIYQGHFRILITMHHHTNAA